EAFLRCPTKAHLYGRGAAAVPNDFGEWERKRLEEFKRLGIERLLRGVPEGEWYIGTPSAQEVAEQRYRIIFGYTATDSEMTALLDALLLDANRYPGMHPYIPVRFVADEKVTRIDKLLLAFDALALSKSCGMMPGTGRIVHGRKCTTVRITVAPLIAEARRLLRSLAACLRSTPDL